VLLSRGSIIAIAWKGAPIHQSIACSSVVPHGTEPCV